MMLLNRSRMKKKILLIKRAMDKGPVIKLKDGNMQSMMTSLGLISKKTRGERFEWTGTELTNGMLDKAIRAIRAIRRRGHGRMPGKVTVMDVKAAPAPQGPSMLESAKSHAIESLQALAWAVLASDQESV